MSNVVLEFNYVYQPGPPDYSKKIEEMEIFGVGGPDVGDWLGAQRFNRERAYQVARKINIKFNRVEDEVFKEYYQQYVRNP